jgi:hypothetical protein
MLLLPSLTYICTLYDILAGARKNGNQYGHQPQMAPGVQQQNRHLCQVIGHFFGASGANTLTLLRRTA